MLANHERDREYPPGPRGYSLGSRRAVLDHPSDERQCRTDGVVLLRRHGDDLRHVARVIGHDHQRSRPITLDVELDPADMPSDTSSSTRSSSATATRLSVTTSRASTPCTSARTGSSPA